MTKKKAKSKKKRAARPKTTYNTPSKKTPGLSEPQEAFLDALTRVGGSITAAIMVAGIGSRQTHYNWLDANEVYATRFKEAIEASVELCEAELYRLALHGQNRERPIVYKGEIKAYERWVERNPRYMEMFLKANRPEKYRENFDVTSGGRPILDIAGIRELYRNAKARENGDDVPTLPSGKGAGR